MSVIGGSKSVVPDWSKYIRFHEYASLFNLPPGTKINMVTPTVNVITRSKFWQRTDGRDPLDVVLPLMDLWYKQECDAGDTWNRKLARSNRLLRTTLQRTADHRDQLRADLSLAMRVLQEIFEEHEDIASQYVHLYNFAEADYLSDTTITDSD